MVSYKQQLVGNMLIQILRSNNVTSGWSKLLGHNGPAAAGHLAIEYVEAVWRPTYADDEDLNQWIERILTDISQTFCCELCSQSGWDLFIVNETLACPTCQAVLIAMGYAPVLSTGRMGMTGFEPVIG